MVSEAHQEKTQRSDAAGIAAKGNRAEKNGKLSMFAAASARVECGDTPDSLLGRAAFCHGGDLLVDVDS